MTRLSPVVVDYMSALKVTHYLIAQIRSYKANNATNSADYLILVKLYKEAVMMVKYCKKWE
jgi:hypothetical protein